MTSLRHFQFIVANVGTATIGTRALSGEITIFPKISFSNIKNFPTRCRGSLYGPEIL